jgi:hypothetical protein
MREMGLSGRGELGGDLESKTHFVGNGVTGWISKEKLPIKSALQADQ